jgi:putative Mg2+ transporter-C (MgtC) family protein
MISLDDALYRLIFAGTLGAVVGAEREWRARSAGLRTNTLIAMGAALFTIMALELSPDGGDTSRVTSQIVTGVGFIGAGAIFREKGQDVVGLTTAATIWVNAAVGIAAGAGHYRLAGLSTIAVLFVLTALIPIERTLERHAKPKIVDPPPGA